MAELGDAAIEPAFVEAMKEIAKFADYVLNGDAKGKDRKIGFALLVFPYGSTDGRCNYISNGADRRDMAVLLREQSARFMGQAEMKGRA